MIHHHIAIFKNTVLLQNPFNMMSEVTYSLESDLSMLLKDNSDQNRIFGLFSLLNNIDSNEFQKNRELIYHALGGATFLNRLLLTNSNEQFAMIAVLVFASFFRDSSKNDDKLFGELKHLWSTICEIIKSAYFLEDSFKRATDTIIDVASELKMANEDVFIPDECASKLILCFCKSVKPTDTHKKLASILSNSLSKVDSQSMNTFISFLHNCDPELAVIGCRLIENSIATCTVNPKDFLLRNTSLISLVFDLLQPTVDEAVRSRAYGIASALFKNIGEDWLGLDLPKDDKSRLKFQNRACLLLEITYAELNVDITILLEHMENGKEKDGEPMPGFLVGLCNCLTVLGQVVKYLVQETDLSPIQWRWNKMDAKHLLKCRDSLSLSFQVIAQFFAVIYNKRIWNRVFFRKCIIEPFSDLLLCWLHYNEYDPQIAKVETEMYPKRLFKDTDRLGGMETLLRIATFHTYPASLLRRINQELSKKGRDINIENRAEVIQRFLVLGVSSLLKKMESHCVKSYPGLSETDSLLEICIFFIRINASSCIRGVSVKTNVLDTIQYDCCKKTQNYRQVTSVECEGFLYDLEVIGCFLYLQYLMDLRRPFRLDPIIEESIRTTVGFPEFMTNELPHLKSGILTCLKDCFM